MKEIFLSGAKAGADMSSFLADAGVILSVGLQSGISAKAFGVSVARVPQSDGSSLPGSAIARGGRFSGEPGGRRIVTGALRKWTGNTGPPPKRRTRPGGGALGSKAVAITRHAINGRPRQKSKVPQTGAGR